ncbi:hypothetical protein [Corynebacterium variabile]|uniref:hypothetical protein n=1 Tax=Corynebacterium variabile TaxID=1727 RepID=UPI0028A65882|nr:hypothetical protein [Corynebacterium variabile]
MTDLSADTPKKPDRETDDRIRELFHESRGRNEIARMCGVTTYRVDQVCKAYGLTFDAERTRKATEVHTASAGEAHRKLAGRFRDLADQALDRANDNICAPEVMWPYVRAAATATDKSIALSDLDARTMHGGDMRDAMDRFTAFGALVRGTAAAQRGEEPP